MAPDEMAPDSGAAPVAAVPPLLSVRGLSKSFGGSPALAGVDLEILPGEVHGLLGENGSGKSTLIKVLAGYHAPEEGELEVDGVNVPLPLAPGEYRRLGFAFVHQDLALIPSLSVTENLFIERLATMRSLGISWSRERRRAREICGAFGLDVDPSAVVADLEPIDRARLAIVRAVHQMEDRSSHGLLVLDEPTVFLPQLQVDTLFRLMREVADRGSSVLFVSHDLNEVRQVTDRVTVLRDGRVAGTRVTKDTDISVLISLIIGRQLAAGELTARVPAAGGDQMVKVSGLTTKTLSSISFTAAGGEILGLTGLLGSGYEEIVYALFGARRATGGELVLQDRRTSLSTMTPERAISLGMALVPADRRRDGAIGSLSVADNITAMTLNRHFRKLHLWRREMYREAAGLTSQFDVRPRDPGLDYLALSGGNQQKALLAKWLQLRPRLLLLHEPTQGVDIGAREQIFELLRNAREGRVVICASSDHEQLAAVCNRVLIVVRGSLALELTGSDVEKDRITEQCLRSTVTLG
jgi:ribose transport system ATP-binding protein